MIRYDTIKHDSLQYVLIRYDIYICIYDLIFCTILHMYNAIQCNANGKMSYICFTDMFQTLRVTVNTVGHIVATGSDISVNGEKVTVTPAKGYKSKDGMKVKSPSCVSLSTHISTFQYFD